MPELPELPEFPDLPEGVEGLDDEEPLVRCKRPQCPNKCAYGRITGENGCLICECRTPDDICLVCNLAPTFEITFAQLMWKITCNCF